MPWTVYILECADKTLYTGVTNDLEKRLAAHAAGRGAKYTRGRGPLRVVYTETKRTKGAALKREYAIKAMPKPEKTGLARQRRKP